VRARLLHARAADDTAGQCNWLAVRSS